MAALRVEWLHERSRELTQHTEKYIISEDTFVSEGCYKSNSLKVIALSHTSGYIYIKYTKALKASDAGKSYAISYKDLTSGSVKISNSYFSNYSECKKKDCKMQSH